MGKIEKVAVIGGGTMGRGIAQTAAPAGFAVSIHDVSEELLRASIDAVRGSLDRAVAKGKIAPEDREATLTRLAPDPVLESAVDGADLVIEAVPEVIDLKRKVFAGLDRAASPRAVLATNTSSLSIAAIGSATTDPARVVGMHFFNPVPAMPLLEVVRGDATGDDAVETALAAGRRMGKEPIVVRDAPGFATSRLGVLLGLEAIRMVEEEVASPEDVDKAMTLGYRHPMGPLRLTDLVGLDVRLAIAEHLYRELGAEAFRPPDLLRQMVARGKLGKKSGEGFYRWDGDKE